MSVIRADPIDPLGLQARRSSLAAPRPVRAGSSGPALTGNLSANPLSDLTNETGVWTLRFICITLAITPLRRLTGWNAAIRFRRMTGLFAFFYGTLHFLIYVIADRFAGLDFPDGIVRRGARSATWRRRSARTSTSGRSSPSASPRG